ncbi:hypothetical protein WN51_04429 [Melipona quadrifasciata]|uniref:Uncharacterized protein n=1 Tax=Melipona quadrifasciata TaxID=166423 RepID=A0A0M8ZTY1_9HYME|nr:hypothetical protein WN51_04429 [Melipona quadrifasciata]
MDESDCGSTCTAEKDEGLDKGEGRKKNDGLGGVRTAAGSPVNSITDKIGENEETKSEEQRTPSGFPPDSAVTSLAPVVIKKDKNREDYFRGFRLYLDGVPIHRGAPKVRRTRMRVGAQAENV